MKIIIVGLGQTGTAFAAEVSKGNHEVIVIDSNQHVVEEVTDTYNVSGVCGSGASKEILKRAGADTADVIVALTPMDEINLMICLIGKKCGTRYAAAKVHRPEFSGDKKYFTDEFQIDCIINPRRDTAREIARQIGLPAALRAEAFFGEAAAVVPIVIDEKSPLDGMKMDGIRSYFETDMLIGSVLREGNVFVPRGDSVLRAGDTIELIASNASLKKIVMKLGMVRRPVKKVLIVGAGTTGRYLAEQLLAEKLQVKILDSDRERCIELAGILPEADIAYAKEVDEKVLLEEGIRSSDVCVTLTGKDETNLVISLFAWSCNVASIITKVNSPSYERLLNKVNIDITISPVTTSVELLMRFIKNVTVYNEQGNDIQRFYQIANGKTSAIEFIAYDDFSKKNVPLCSKDFRLKKDVVIGAIIRKGQVIIPNGQSSIQTGDRVVVIAKNDSQLNILNDIFA